MELRVEPTAELALKFQGKKIGRLEALCLDLSGGGGLFGVPKIKLSLSINAASFDNDASTLNLLTDKLSKFKWLDIVIRK